MRRRRVAAALAALALAGCAGEGEEAAPSESPAELLAQAADRLREQATFTVDSTAVRTRADRPDEHETIAELRGAVELGSGRGRATVELNLGLPESGDEPGLDDPIELRWDRSAFEAEIGGERSRLSRGEARENGGAIGRIPDELEGLVELLERGTNVRALDDDHLAFTVPGADTAEAWLDDEGRPEKIVTRLEQKATAALPARTVEVTYELADFGESVSGLEFRSQAG
jgi:hypothetical protein